MAIGPDGQVRRKCSGRLRLPGRVEPNGKDLVLSLQEQFGEKTIDGMQSFGMGRYELLFASESLLNKAVEKGFLFGNVKVDIEQVDTPVKWLYVKYAPFEVDQQDFEQYLAPYGEVRSVDFIYPDDIKPWHNGERKIKFVMKKDLPNFLKIGQYTVQIRYAGVVSLCRKCHERGHLAKACKNDKCRKCGKAGHLEAECRNELEDGLSPGMQKIVEKARDELLENLKAARTLNVLTLEEEQLGKTSSEQPEQGQEDGDSEKMPELESEEEQKSEEEQESEEDPEDTRDKQNLERKKYLKEKEGMVREREINTCQKDGPGKKKMTKQERKKRRQSEERERNSKREREKSSSPTTGVDEESENRLEERNRSQEEKEESKQAESETEREGKERNKDAKYYLFYDMKQKSVGDIRELISSNFASGVVHGMRRMEDGAWAIIFTEKRWALQADANGIRDNKKLWYPIEKLEVTSEKTINF